jgi:hypothetical protein
MCDFMSFLSAILHSANASSPWFCELRMRAFIAWVSPWLGTLRRIWSADLRPSGVSVSQAVEQRLQSSDLSCIVCSHSASQVRERASALCSVMLVAYWCITVPLWGCMCVCAKEYLFPKSADRKVCRKAGRESRSLQYP